MEESSFDKFLAKIYYEITSLATFPSNTMSAVSKAKYLWKKHRTDKEEMALALLLYLIEIASSCAADMQDAWRVMRSECSHMESKYSEIRVRLYIDREYHNSANPNTIKQDWFKC